MKRKRTPKKRFGQKIRELMAAANIGTVKELTDRIREEAEKAGKKGVSASAVGQWRSDQASPKSESLMFLARALNVSADLILYDEKAPDESQESLRRIAAEVAEAEIKKALSGKNISLENALDLFQKSEAIPREDKEIILAQIKRLLKRYEGPASNDLGSENLDADGSIRHKE